MAQIKTQAIRRYEHERGKVEWPTQQVSLILFDFFCFFQKKVVSLQSRSSGDDSIVGAYHWTNNDIFYIN